MDGLTPSKYIPVTSRECVRQNGSLYTSKGVYSLYCRVRFKEVARVEYTFQAPSCLDLGP